MLLATHAITGAIVGRASPDPVVAFVIGFISHFLLDMIPHGDAGLNKDYRNNQKIRRAVAYVTMDAVLTVYLILGIRQAHQFDDGANVSAGIAGGLLPDFLIGLYYVLKPQWLEKFHDLHFFFHNFIVNRRRDIPLSLGIGLQAVIIMALQVRI